MKIAWFLLALCGLCMGLIAHTQNQVIEQQNITGVFEKKNPAKVAPTAIPVDTATPKATPTFDAKLTTTATPTATATATPTPTVKP